MSRSRGSLTPVMPAGDTLRFEYNPTEFSTSKGAEWAEIGIPGLDFPLQQFVRGGLKTLDLDVYLNRDFYDSRHDVRAAIESFERLVEKTADTAAPPVCIFEWGPFSFTCVVGTLGVKYTMFDPYGEPIEATLSLALRQYREKKQSFKLPPQPVSRKKGDPVFSGSLGSGSALAHPDEKGPASAKGLVEKGQAKTHTAQKGESNQSISSKHYGVPDLWRAVEFANRGRRLADNMRSIGSGERYIIPDLENAAEIMERTTGFPPEVRQSLGTGRQGITQVDRLVSAVRR